MSNAQTPTRHSAAEKAEKAYQRRRSQVWLSPNEAAAVLGVAPKTIYRLIASGELPARRIRGTRVIRVAAIDVDRLLAEVPAPGQ